MPDCLLTVEEAAEYLRIKPITVFKLVRSGKLSHGRLGDTKNALIRFTLEDLQSYVRRVEVEGQE